MPTSFELTYIRQEGSYGLTKGEFIHLTRSFDSFSSRDIVAGTLDTELNFKEIVFCKYMPMTLQEKFKIFFKYTLTQHIKEIRELPHGKKAEVIFAKTEVSDSDDIDPIKKLTTILFNKFKQKKRR